MAKEVIKHIRLLSNEERIKSLPVNRRIKCDLSYINIVGINDFGHINNELTLLKKANEEQKDALMRRLAPCPDMKDGTENMTLKDAFASVPSRYAGTAKEASEDVARIASYHTDIAAAKAAEEEAKAAEEAAAKAAEEAAKAPEVAPAAE